LVLEPDGDAYEAGGVLNPACARAPGGELLLYPRDVENGNISRIGIVRTKARDGGFDVARDGYALEPHAEYELRPSPGYGCEDPRVTFMPSLETYVMAYTAFGPAGPRVALAVSKDAYKDAAFFHEPVLSPAGVESYAFYHRPMLHLSAVDGRAAIPMIERMPFEDRESIRIAYVPADAVRADVKNLLKVSESVLVISPDERWGSIKVGSGTPPQRIAEGWMSIFHGVDLLDNEGARPKFRYVAGLVIHDAQRPDRILYRSPDPIYVPESDRETNGVVDNVVFPTGIDPRPDLGARTFDVYYGMADYSIGAFRMTL
jgi:predicted GH43/DUF377 family glycosyl hydrolase